MGNGQFVHLALKLLIKTLWRTGRVGRKLNPDRVALEFFHQAFQTTPSNGTGVTFVWGFFSHFLLHVLQRRHPLNYYSTERGSDGGQVFFSSPPKKGPFYRHLLVPGMQIGADRDLPTGIHAERLHQE